jgi:hypothetical protein
MFIRSGFLPSYFPTVATPVTPVASYAPSLPMYGASMYAPSLPSYYPSYPSYPAYTPYNVGFDPYGGSARMAMGALKMIPGLGNLANGVDFVRDLGQMGQALRGDPTKSVFKEGADLLFHGLGMLMPQIGGAYDLAQGAVRAGAGYGWGGYLPSYSINYGGYSWM